MMETKFILNKLVVNDNKLKIITDKLLVECYKDP